MKVTDDGDGFDPDEPHAGMGLANMAARARAMGGWLKVESEYGVGTVVEARIPLSQSASSA